MQKFFKLFKPRPPISKTPSPVMQSLLRMLAMTEEVELSCDQVYDLLDQFAEKVRGGEDAAHLMPLVEKHLGRCPDCQEEYETLLRMMEIAT